VLLYHLIYKGKQGLNELNGFFSLAFFDSQEQKLLLARDRFGIKPMYYFQDEDKFIFGSEAKSVLAYNIKPSFDFHALHLYFQYNYIPAPLTLYEGLKKMLPGSFIEIEKNKKVTQGKYYVLPQKPTIFTGTYEGAKELIVEKLEKSVVDRLIADVPLGAFLSGGVDSSIITGLASKHKSDLETFSVGFPDDPFHDESAYSKEVAKHFGTKHEVFEIYEKELLDTLHNTCAYFAEPFADSSAIAVNALCSKTHKNLKVALSGDGADELFGGYMKHQALQMAIKNDWKVVFAKAGLPIWKMMPKSRNDAFSNNMRRLEKLGYLAKMTSFERYLFLCRITNSITAKSWIDPKKAQHITDDSSQLIPGLDKNPEDLNANLFNDLKFVLPNDMLMKVDHMSMANSLEVRVPFLDHHFVEFVLSLPSEWKCDGKRRKKILADSFENMLPKNLANRPKKGFEVPILKWMRRELKSELDVTVFNKDKIESLGLLNWNNIIALKSQIHSKNPGDSAARVWALYCLIKSQEQF
jgi:asparagine synthase (glutamine-hydrolysing)